MALPQLADRFDYEAYLAWEDTQEERHEYVAGEVFAMSGGTDAHYTITGNTFASLRDALRGSPCRAFVAGMQVRIAETDSGLYPDVFVTCDARDRGEAAVRAKSHPKLVIEVLSPSTAAWDRGRKFELYQQIDALEEYLLIEQDRLHADLFRRNAEGLWVLHPIGPGGVVKLASVGVDMALETFYEDVELDGLS